ncbi:hypothetical protein KAX17_18435 [Candidatus Bipolaricaulota bacterium]|nr:hypothetical protein [Candidatus Bipolaricaulota bacterium]
MRYVIGTLTAVGVLVLVLLTVCAETPLCRVLELVPVKLSGPMIQFTNWTKIKSLTGFDFVTSESPLELRIALAHRISEDQAAGSAFALMHLREHADTWGWDTTDLKWEANIISREIPPTYILKLRAGFDFAPVAARFEERGFVQTESYGARVFTHEIDLSLDWVKTTEFSIHTTAYIEEENLLLLSSYPGTVEAFLATRAGKILPLSENPHVQAAVENLNDPAAAMLLIGAGTCGGFTASPILELIGKIPDEETIAELKATIEESPTLFPYWVLAAGYRYEEDRPVGTIAFQYDSPEAAETDLSPRRALAEAGMSSAYERPIAEAYFTVLTAEVKGSAIVLTVAPVNDQPRRLFRMLLYLDAPFAGCG